MSIQPPEKVGSTCRRSRRRWRRFTHSMRRKSSTGCFATLDSASSGATRSVKARSSSQRRHVPDVTFFMIVTPRDVVIADYAVRSYAKLSKHVKDFQLLVYSNYLLPEQKDYYFP